MPILREILSTEDLKKLRHLCSSEGVLEQGDGKPNLTNAESFKNNGGILEPKSIKDNGAIGDNRLEESNRRSPL